MVDNFGNPDTNRKTHQDDALATYLSQHALSVVKHTNGSISLYTNHRMNSLHLEGNFNWQ